MSQFFSMKRFAAYSRKQYSENRKLYLFGTLLIVLAVAGIFWALSQRIILSTEIVILIRPQLALICTLLLLSVSIFAFFLQWNSRDLANPSKNILYLLTPASSFEKYAFVWLNSVGLSLFVLLVFGAMYRLFGLFVEYSGPHRFFEILSDLGPFLLVGHALSLFLLVVFRRHGLLAGIVVIAAFMFCGGILPMWLNKWGLTGGASPGDPFYSLFRGFTNGFEYDVSWIPAAVRPCVDTLLCALIAVTLWTAGYFKLKEKQLN
jgi:hypothetical protein